MEAKEMLVNFFFLLGFTQVDPATIQQTDLPKSALPNLGLNNKFSYVKRLYETLTKQLCIIFYYNPEYVRTRQSSMKMLSFSDLI